MEPKHTIIASVLLIGMTAMTAGCATQSPPDATKEAMVKSQLAVYVGETCQGMANGHRNVDTIFEKDGLIYSHHRYATSQGEVSDSALHDAGLRIINAVGNGPGPWSIMFVSDSGANEFYSPTPVNPSRLKVRIEAGSGSSEQLIPATDKAGGPI